MAIIPVNYLPIAYGGTNPLNFARNAVGPSGSWARFMADRCNYVIGGRLKQLFSKSIRPTQAINQAAEAETWRFYCHTSPNAIAVRTRVVCAPSDAAGNVDPRFYWETTDFTADPDVVTNRETMRSTARITNGGTVNPKDYAKIDQEFTVTADVDYGFELHVFDNCRPISATVYEVVRPSLNTATDKVVSTKQYAQNIRIFNGNLTDLVTETERSWKRQGGQYVAWSVDALTSKQTTSTSSVNMLDATKTAYADGDPGFRVNTQNRGSFDSNNVPATFAVYAAMDVDGTGNGNVKLVNAATSVASPLATITVNDTSAKWYTASVNLDATNADDNLQVYFTGSSASRKTNLYAVSVFDYVA